MKVDGSGLLQGCLRLEQGKLLDGSDLKVTAPKLILDILDYHVVGVGKVNIAAGQEDVDVMIQFSSLQAFDTSRDALLFKGNGLAVEAQGNGSILDSDDIDKPFQAKRLAVTILAVEVLDYSVEGKGSVSMQVEKGGQKSDMSLAVKLTPYGRILFLTVGRTSVRQKLTDWQNVGLKSDLHRPKQNGNLLSFPRAAWERLGTRCVFYGAARRCVFPRSAWERVNTKKNFKAYDADKVSQELGK